MFYNRILLFNIKEQNTSKYLLTKSRKIDYETYFCLFNNISNRIYS